MKKNVIALLGLVIALVLVACGGTAAPADTNSGEEAASDEAAEEEISGRITVLTNRTDIVDTVFVEYAERFNEIYPDVTVEFEAVTDYEGEVQIRMNTDDYGDVLLIPNGVPTDELPDFFEPLGSVQELEDQYIFVTEDAFDGQVYGIPVVGNVQGIVYNRAVFEEAGIAELPGTPEEFLEAMRMIRDNTDAIPYYTNYAAGWPLVQWEGHRGSVTGNPDYSNEMVYMESPFAEGSAHYTIYRLMYDLVAEGLVEVDPTTTDWEGSKTLIGTGQVGAMVLGSWAIVQMEEAADDATDIGYMPFPVTVDGERYAEANGDYKIGINVNSDNKAAARAWLDWFLNESNFAFDQGGIPPVIGSEYPPQLSAFSDMGVNLVQMNPARPGEEGWLDEIDSEAEIGLWDPAFRQRIIEAALGNTDETFDDIMADLNARWAEAQAEVVSQ
ncbi:MAG: carbohydrate ABC transporter substrate-binding protein [Chloroflexi bacterium]|nr:carbohydrate ABC transporter substrate-binding protein [Chloroflexota bacterium]